MKMRRPVDGELNEVVGLLLDMLTDWENLPRLVRQDAERLQDAGTDEVQVSAVFFGFFRDQVEILYEMESEAADHGNPCLSGFSTRQMDFLETLMVRLDARFDSMYL